MCITGYWHVSKLQKSAINELSEFIPQGNTCQRLLKMSEKYQLSIGAGLIEKDHAGNLYNSYVMAMPDGQLVNIESCIRLSVNI